MNKNEMSRYLSGRVNEKKITLAARRKHKFFIWPYLYFYPLSKVYQQSPTSKILTRISVYQCFCMAIWPLPLTHICMV